MSPKTLAPRAIGLQGGDGATAPSWTRIQIRCPIAALDKSGESGQARFHAPIFKRRACSEHSNFFKGSDEATVLGWVHIQILRPSVLDRFPGSAVPYCKLSAIAGL